MNKFGSITAAELDDMRKEIIIEIRSILCSAKQGLTEFELRKEYSQLFGKEIPYTSLGFNSIYELMRSMPEACYSQKHRTGNIWVYFPCIDESIKDLAELVRGQKTDKLTKLREQYRSQARSKSSNSSYRFQRNSYSSGSQFRTAQNVNSTIMPTNYERNVPADVQQQIRFILANNNGRLPLGEFENFYKLKYGSRLDFRQHGFNSMRHLFESIPHLVVVKMQSGTFDGTDLICLTESNQQIVTETPVEPDVPAEYAEIPAKDLAKSSCDSAKPEPKKNNVSPLEQELIDNIVKLLKSKKSIALSDLKSDYEGFIKKPLEFEKLGYRNITELIKNLEMPDIRVTCVLPTYENILVYEDDSNQLTVADEVNCSSDSDEDYNEEYKIMHLKKLEPYIKSVFKVKRRAYLSEFLSLFERHNGWVLDFRTYGFKNNDALFSSLVNLNLIRSELVAGKFLFNCDHLFETKCEKSTKENKIEFQQILEAKKLEEIEKLKKAKYNLEFIQSYIIYNSDLTNTEILKLMALKTEHKILISNAIHPNLIEIQLYSQGPKLEKLMDDLEARYTGFGASDFNMPETYMLSHRLCAAIYRGDGNWHRCRIVDKNRDLSIVLVHFVDYGGEDWVEFKNVRFLYKDFNLPLQAIKAKFANIKFNPKNEEQKIQVTNYLLNKIMNKPLIAKIFGFNEGFLSLDVFETTTEDHDGCPTGTRIHLNSRIVMDGFGVKYDESKDIEFKDYETWKLEILASKDDDSQIQEKINTDLNNNETKIVSYNNNGSNSPKNKSSKQTKRVQSLKVKEVVYFDSEKKKSYKLNIMKISDNETIYVHWTQVASLFAISKRVFKDSLKRYVKENYNNETSYVEVFEKNDQNEELFEIVDETIKIGLKSINEKSELFLLKFYSLYEIADDLLDEENSQRLQNFVINCKVSGNNVNPELLAAYNSFLNDDQSANSESRQQNTYQDLSSKIGSMSLKNMADETVVLK